MSERARPSGPLALAIALQLALAGCGPAHENGVAGTVALGDDFVAPDLQLDESFFYCRIQPEVLTKHSCASGAGGEEGSCHSAMSALRLIATDDLPPCDGDVLTDSPPAAYEANLEAIRFSVQSDPLTSPLYLRPLNRASHPREIFDANDPAAELIVEWISGASP